MFKIGDVVATEKFDGSFNIGVIIDIVTHGNPNLIGSKITHSYLIENKSQKLIEIDVDRANLYLKVRLATKEEIEKEYSDSINFYSERYSCYNNNLDSLYECIKIKLDLDKCFKFTKKYDKLFGKLIIAEKKYIQFMKSFNWDTK